MPTPCFSKWQQYDAQHQKCKKLARKEDRLRKARNNLASVLGVSIATVIAVAGALAALAATGVGAGAAIAGGIAALGIAALWIGRAAAVALVVAIIAHLKALWDLSDCEDAVAVKRSELISTNAEDVKELEKLLSLTK